MPHRLQTIFMTAISLVLAVGTAGAAADGPVGVGGPYGEYYMAYNGPETLTLLVQPDGGGDPFDQATLPYGGQEDATITVLLKNVNYEPVPGYPREDIWLESRDGGLVICAGGTIADADTDAAGMTSWAAPLHAGGYSEALTEVKVNGSPIYLTSGVKLSFNSPDINGDRLVNLTDVQIFTQDFYSNYDFRSDFHHDGNLNLSDIAKIAQAFGADCP